MTEPIKIVTVISGERQDEVWRKTFGSGWETWGWSDVEYLDGSDWNKPGRAKVWFYNLDEYQGRDEDGYAHYKVQGEAVVTPADLWKALERTMEKEYCDTCTGRPITERSDWDACVSDLILQMAVLGEVTFG